ncbi:MAG TPA: tetratricopeptide repeat protein, partial [Opitutaceae bacterium]|nr:tetratricopeptide repeat protein [Opitutaceae bacterium]
PSIRQLWPLTDVLMPPRGKGLTVEGRPVLNLSLALNHATGGLTVRGYHVFNVVVHALAALTLYGVVRRTLLLPRMRGRPGDAAHSLAALVALLWALHPLQTESVTYVIQRAEALVGLFYLLTLYAFVRCAGGPSGPALPWKIVCVIACLIGMATKEVMVSAPLIILLFDRAFCAGSFGEAWRQRRGLHAALFSTWLLLGALVLATGTRGGTAGFGINVTPWAYAQTQFEAVTRYLALSFWPHPLIFDYGVRWVQGVGAVLPHALVVLSLSAATILAWRRSPAVAWLALLFFAVLSPTSSIVPGNRQTLAEHRMYLPLAAVIVLVVVGVDAAIRQRRRVLFTLGVATAIAFGVLTVRRNFDYRSEVALYRDTALKRPDNGFARYNLGKALAEIGRHADALAEYEAALPLMANAPGVQYNRANSLAALGRKDDAVAGYEGALRAEPRYPRAHFNLGNVLVELGRKKEAAAHFATAVSQDAGLLEARANLGGVLLELGRLGEARDQLEQVLRRDGNHVLALFNLGNVCLLEKRGSEAVRLFERVLALRPDLAIARDRLEQARGLPR